MLKLLTFLLPFLLLATSSTSHPTDACPQNKPPHHNKCNKDPDFTLHDISYMSSMTYSTPAHLAVAQGYISFNLTNTAVPYKTHCSAFSSRITDFFFGDIVYHCDAPTGKGVSEGASANFTFSKPDGVFDVNQTWSSDTEEHHKAENFLGFGSGKAALDCNTTVWTNANWTLGQIYSITTTKCKPAELHIEPTVVEIH